MGRKRSVFVLMGVILLVTVSTAWTRGKAEKKEELQLYATAAVLLDGDSGRVLYGKKENAVLPMASTTKIMTCILALENGDLDNKVPVSAYAASMPDVQLNAREGEEYILKDLLYSLMLESHNDSAVIIAEAIDGSVEAFAERMNHKAREIGCTSTTFITPNGLDAETINAEGETVVHSTTAEDLARIMKYCISDSQEKEMFLEITGTPSYSFTDCSGSRSFQCSNHNAFLNMMEGALSGKTGFTGNAGYCYVGALRQGDRTFIVALLACGWPNNKTYKWSDTRKLMEYGLENYQYQNVLETKELEPITVSGGIPASGQLYEEAVTGLYIDYNNVEELQVLLTEGEEVKVQYEFPDYMEAPAAAETQVGQVTYELEGKTLAVFPIRTETSVNRVDFYWYFYQAIRMFLPQQKTV